MDKIFQILSEEAQFTAKILGIGLTQLRKANYTQKGYYFSSFTAISTGLERIGKLSLILDYYIKHNGEFPPEKTVKTEIGHDLEKLYEKSKKIVYEYSISFQFSNKVDSNLHLEILSIFSKFAKGDRYSNINYLVKSNHQSDPISRWHSIDLQLFEERVSSQRKKIIIETSKSIGQSIEDIIKVLHTSDSRNEINDVENALYLMKMHEAISKFRQLYVLQIIRYWVEILIGLYYKSFQIKKNAIPDFKEIFISFYLTDEHCLTIKTYDK